MTVTTKSIVLPCTGIGPYACECIKQQYLVFEVSVKSGISAALILDYVFK